MVRTLFLLACFYYHTHPQPPQFSTSSKDSWSFRSIIWKFSSLKQHNVESLHIYLAPDQAEADKEIIYPTAHANLSCKMSPTAGMLWLKPEQKLKLASFNMPICEMQKLGYWLMGHWAIPAAGLVTCGRWAGHTASISNCSKPSQLNPLLNINQLPDNCLCKHQNYWSLTSYGLASYGRPAFKLIFVKKIPWGVLSWVKEIPFLLPIFFHSRTHRLTNKDSNIISTQFLTEIGIKPSSFTLMSYHFIPLIKEHFNLFSIMSIVFSEINQPLKPKNCMVRS